MSHYNTQDAYHVAWSFAVDTKIIL